jgi:hypothetical protein
MEKNRRFRLIPTAFLLVALGGILSTVGFVQRSVSEDPIFLGLSTARLIIFFVLVIGIITSFSIALVTRNIEFLHFPLTKNRFTTSMTGLIFLLGTFYFLSFLPSYILVGVADLLDNLRPLFFWGFGTILLFIFVFLFSQFGSHSNHWLAYWKPRRHVWRTALIATGLMIIVAGAGIALKVMEYRDEDFWYSTGVPILAWQVILAIILGFLIPRIIRKDKILFFMIWVIAGVLWASWPYKQTFSMSPPLPPNYESYPIFDATYYDLGSQFALIGEGINGWIFTDRPLYMFFLFSLHKIAGQDYVVLEILQAALFALFPAIVYLIGQRLHSQQAGITAGLLIIFRGINSLIASPWIDNSHLKDMLIDFPTAVAVGALTLFLVRALQNRKWTDLLWATGVLGFALLLRIHTLIFIPLLVAVAVFLLFGQPWKHWLGAGGLLALGLSFTLLPWLLWNSTSVSRFVQFRLERMLEQRYTSTENIAPPRAERSLSSQPVRQKVSNPRVAYSEPSFQVVHLLHNLMVTPFSLPVTFSLNDIRHTVKENPYWDPSWNGGITPSVMLSLSITLLVVSLGIGVGTHKGRFAGITPAIILLAYYAANSFARTSGGRYLVPVDWILYLYLAIGLIELIRVVRVYFGVHTDLSFQRTLFHPNPWSKQTGTILGVLLTLGVMIPFIPGFVQPIYPQKLNKRKVLNLVNTTDLWSLTSLTKDQINGFSSHKKSVAVQGQALYPMYFKQDNGLPLAPKFSQSVRSYPRLVFKVIGPKLNTFVILPSETIPALPHATEVIVIGCREQHEIQALAVILPEQGVGHIRSPESPLSCPLKIPICDNNKNCQ